ncbi:LuxR C-terminal-related transcriptional regulator [Hoeflea poritis]|uniref:LuxR C-terminal-related transcriptional regulator n=1 Tax=Hoeflea poritis TaxID=2993659 RepID=A0ABT4VUA6_9HYPH|nr:LuxR C-terminal-related transcriptional regulator [Hoeflea poritis]MDA4848297.1 LuxR C-terminal-related transcriptional regulator [Hoeflea poritis]
MSSGSKRDEPDYRTLCDLAFDNAPIGLVLTENRIIRACNRTFADIFGYEKDELIGQSFRVLYASNEDFEQIRDIGLQALKIGGQYTDERIMPRKDGSLFWCRFRAHSLTPDEPLQRAILSYADISDHRPYLELSARERQIVTHLLGGKTSKEIARLIGISPRTVEYYRSRLLKKFNASNVTELLAHLGSAPV